MIDTCIKAINARRSVLITGETGTGKSLLARRIHDLSEVSSLSFRQININSYNESLFESELFGHVKGAFTGAYEDKKGIFELIGEGTLFIDEIDSLDFNLQTKLLTVLEEKTFTPIGSSEEKKFKGRVIFAAQLGLKELVYSGKFRKDFYFRISTVEFRVSPLRSTLNRSELKLLFKRFSGQLGIEYFPSEELISSMLTYSWPGNYRELKSCIEYLLFSLGSEGSSLILFEKWRIDCGLKESCEKNANFRVNVGLYEKELITKALIHNLGRINQTSRYLSLNKATLIAKIKKYDIKTGSKIISA